MSDKEAEDKPKVTPETSRRLLALVPGTPTTRALDLEVGEDEVLVWPHLLYIELLATLLITALLWAFSLWVNAPLEEIANSTHSPNPAKAPWYFLGLQELLVYFDPWIAGVVIPGLIIVGLMAIPYMDPNRKATGRYTFRERPFAVTIFSVGLAIWFILIIIGVWFRGPSWGWYWPWESWAEPREIASTHNLSLVVGGGIMAVYFGAGLVLPAILRPKFYRSLGLAKYSFVVINVLIMFGILGKIALRLLFDIKYIVHTPWFNI